MKAERNLAPSCVPKPLPVTAAAALATACLAAFVLTGCLTGGGEPPPEIRHHVVEYEPPGAVGLEPTGAVIKVDRFLTSPAYDTPEMLYRTEPYERRSYNYHRWLADPGQIVSSYLVRDLRVVELFRAVLPARSMDPARFRLAGEVEEFLEVDSDDRGAARLVVQIMLWDDDAEGIAGSLLMQSRYSLSGPERSQTAEGLAASMSKAMGELSARVLRDVHRAVLEARTGRH